MHGETTLLQYKEVRLQVQGVSCWLVFKINNLFLCLSRSCSKLVLHLKLHSHCRQKWQKNKHFSLYCSNMYHCICTCFVRAPTMTADMTLLPSAKAVHASLSHQPYPIVSLPYPATLKRAFCQALSHCLKHILIFFVFQNFVFFLPGSPLFSFSVISPSSEFAYLSGLFVYIRYLPFCLFSLLRDWNFKTCAGWRICWSLKQQTCCKPPSSLLRPYSELMVCILFGRKRCKSWRSETRLVHHDCSSFKGSRSYSFLDWDREKLLEAWMVDADGCCQRSGVAMPTPPPSGYNAWDTLPSPRTPRTPRSPLTLTLTSPTDSCLTPGEEGLSMVRCWW